MNRTENTPDNPLGTEPLGTLMLRFCIPSVISMLVQMFYNLVDQIFIGQGVGYLGNAATSIILPQTTIVMSIGQLIGCGCAAYASLNMGKGNYKKAVGGVGTAITATFSFGIILAVLFEILMAPLCTLFGATVDSMPYALDYGRIIAMGFPFYICATVFTNIFRTDGRPNVALFGMLIGFTVNMILDPLFVLVFHWGVKGAAWATILGQIMNTLYYSCNLRRCKVLKLTKTDFCINFRVLGNLSRLGVSAFITQIESVFVQLVTNNILVHYGSLSKYGPDIPMAAYGVTCKVMIIFGGIATGIIVGTQPILGFNYGSGQYDRVKKTYRNVLTISTTVLVAAWFLFEFAPGAVVHLFGQDSALYEEFAIKSLRIFMLICPALGFINVTPIFFQSIGKPVQATILSVSRQLVFLLLSTVIMSYLIGVEGVLWSGPISHALSTVLTLFMVTYYWKKIFNTELK